MSALLDSLCGTERLAEIASNDAAKLSLFQVYIGPRAAPRMTFGAMATDSFAAHQEYVSLAEPGERVEVVAIGSGEPFPIRAARQELEVAQLRNAMTEAEAMLVAQDRAYEADKQSGALERRRIARTAELEAQAFRIAGLM